MAKRNKPQPPPAPRVCPICGGEMFVIAIPRFDDGDEVPTVAFICLDCGAGVVDEIDS